MAVSFLVSLALNLIALFGLLFVTVSERPPPPPAIAVASVVVPVEEASVPAAPRPSSSAAASASRVGGAPSLPVVAAATAVAASDFTMAPPSLPAYDFGTAGIAAIGPSFGLGGGLGGGIGTGGGGAPMKIGKITVKAKNLGVVLDVSGSMQEELPGVRKELRSAFRSAKIVEVEGCGLHWNKPEEEGEERRRSRREEERKIRLRSTADSVIEAVEMLVVDGKIDALYWFSDLQDGESQAGLERLGELLSLKKGKGRAVRLYVRSLEREPSRKLAAIARASGGAVQAGEKGD